MYEAIANQLRNKAGAFVRDSPDIACDYIRAADTIEELIHAIESPAITVIDASNLLRKRWISVTEGLPTHNGWYLAFGPTIKVKILHFYSASKVWVYSEYGKVEVTHWMPIPEPPKEVVT